MATNPLQSSILLTALTKGRYRATTKNSFDACHRLVEAGMLEESEVIPGMYLLTPFGETHAEKINVKEPV